MLEKENYKESMGWDWFGLILFLPKSSSSVDAQHRFKRDTSLKKNRLTEYVTENPLSSQPNA